MTENQKTTSTSSRSSTTTTRTQSPACSDYDLSVLSDEYTEALGFPPTTAVMIFLRNCLMDGIEPPVISHAIGETAWARYPSPHYLHAILTRYKRSGLLTMEAVMMDDRQRYELHQSSTRRRNADMYDLR